MLQSCLPLEHCPDANPLQLLCQDHQYNAMASLVFNTPEETIKNLFHAERNDIPVCGSSPRPVLASQYHNCANVMQSYVLGIYFLVSLFLVAWTLGLPIPSGLLVPSLMIGCRRSNIAQASINYLQAGPADASLASFSIAS